MIPLIPGYSVAFPQTGPSSCFTKTTFQPEIFRCSQLPLVTITPSRPNCPRQFCDWKMRPLGPQSRIWCLPMMPHWEGSTALAVLLGWPKSHHPSVIGIFQGDIMRPGYCLAPQSDIHSSAWACWCLKAESATRGCQRVTVSIIPSTLASRFSPEKRASLLPYLFSIATDSQITDLFSVYQCFFRKLMVFRNQDLGSLLLGLWWLTGSLQGEELGKTGWRDTYVRCI